MIDFISLRLTLTKIAEHITVSEDDITYYSELVGAKDESLKMCTYCTGSFFKMSRAAMQLSALLFRQHQKIDWFDKGDIGTPLFLPQAKEEAKALLINWAVREQKLKQELNLHYLSSYSRWSEVRSELSTLAYSARLPRMWEIGFDRTQIIPLLVEHKMIPAPVIDVVPPSVKKGKHYFRGELSEILEEAVERAESPEDEEAIWIEMVKFARSVPPYFPITGYCAKKGILYEIVNKDGTSENETSSMTKSQFMKRIRRRIKSD